VATTLVEASHRMTYVAALQERAIRAAVLEEAIALDRRPQAPQLAGQVASFGLSFQEELRIVVTQPATGRTSNATALLEERLPRLLAREGIPHMISARERYATVLVQCTPTTLRRILVAEASALPDVLVGVGRRVREIADITHSFHDAQLAVRSLSRTRSERRFMSHDEFDFATRLFSDVGLDSMLAWADEFLAPLDREGPLFESLQVYFEQNQNINAAAELLHVHHNSLRYRLTKVEELLKVSLRDPAAVSSVFLALAAVDLGTMQASKRSATPTTGRARPADIEAPGTPADIAGRSTAPHGVVLPAEQ
jgi:sugar diacid utilization regulator